MLVTICHLYPDLLNVNGSVGNLIALLQRCRWRGIDVQHQQVCYGDAVSFADCDFVFIGGGSEQGQALAQQELKRWARQLRFELESGLLLLAIGEGYQLLGEYYEDATGSKKEGLGLMPFYTRSTNPRMTGRIVVEMELDGIKKELVGFENHRGKTYLNGTEALGKVRQGHGNNGQDGMEGARFYNAFCTYLQGPLLPLNPFFTDYLIELLYKRKGYPMELSILDDEIEELARQTMLKRIRSESVLSSR